MVFWVLSVLLYLLLWVYLVYFVIDGLIKIIVVLVMENWFFDYMLGYLNWWNLDIDGLSGVEFNVVDNFNFIESSIFYVFDIVEFVDFDFGYFF